MIRNYKKALPLLLLIFISFFIADSSNAVVRWDETMIDLRLKDYRAGRLSPAAYLDAKISYETSFKRLKARSERVVTKERFGPKTIARYKRTILQPAKLSKFGAKEGTCCGWSQSTASRYEPVEIVMSGTVYSYEFDVAVPNDPFFNEMNRSELSQFLSDIVDRRRSAALKTIEGAMKSDRVNMDDTLIDGVANIAGAVKDAEVEIYKVENATIAGLPTTAARGSRLIRIKGKRVLWDRAGRPEMRVLPGTEEEGHPVGLGPFPCEWDEGLVRRGAEGYLANRCINTGGVNAKDSWRKVAKGSLKDASTGEAVPLLYLTLTGAPDAPLDEYKSEEQIKSEPLENYAAGISESLAPIVGSIDFADVELEGMAVHDTDENGNNDKGHELIFDFGNITETSADGGKARSGSVVVPVTIKKDSSGEAVVAKHAKPLFARARLARALPGASPVGLDFSNSYEGDFEIPSEIKAGRYLVTVRGECHDPLQEVFYIGPAMKPLNFKSPKKPLKIVIKTKDTEGEERSTWNDPPESVRQTTLERLKSLGIRQSSVDSISHTFVKNFYKRPQIGKGVKGTNLPLKKAGELWEVAIRFLPNATVPASFLKKGRSEERFACSKELVPKADSDTVNVRTREAVAARGPYDAHPLPRLVSRGADIDENRFNKRLSLGPVEETGDSLFDVYFDFPIRGLAKGSKSGTGDSYFKKKSSWGQDYADQWALRRVLGLSSAQKSKRAKRSKKGKTAKSKTDSAEPVVLAIIDSGIDITHPDLAGALWMNLSEIDGNGKDDDGNGYIDDLFGWNFVDNSNDIRDDSGHGTLVAGIIGADSGMRGVNPGARLMALKVIDFDLKGGSIALARAIFYAVDNGADIINISLGGRKYSRLLEKAVKYAAMNSVLVVASSGNTGETTMNYSPAGLPGVLTVAATDTGDKRAPFSNWGPHVDIAAPGVDILSLRAAGTDYLVGIKEGYEAESAFVGNGDLYYRSSGSSLAAPFVSGAASLILAAHPELTDKELTNMLLHSARDIDTPGRDRLSGYGLLDIPAAIVADPRSYQRIEIDGIRFIDLKKKSIIEVLGTVDSDSLKEYRLYIGRGTNPKKWIKSGKKRSATVIKGVIGSIAVKDTRGGAEWTLRIETTHTSGERREARYLLRLRH